MKAFDVLELFAGVANPTMNLSLLLMPDPQAWYDDSGDALMMMTITIMKDNVCSSSIYEHTEVNMWHTRSPTWRILWLNGSNRQVTPPWIICGSFSANYCLRNTLTHKVILCNVVAYCHSCLIRFQLSYSWKISHCTVSLLKLNLLICES